VDLLLEKLKSRLADKQLELEVTENAKYHIIEGGYDVMYGARPLKRYIQQHIETLVSREIISKDLEPGTKMIVDYNDS
jgi:ATP-dependent Clp protease ATP-binding subunit ClpB